ncbi:MAG: hypothetical protein Q9216_004072 [Gyalolechia sp. 2 TL-2023]
MSVELDPPELGFRRYGVLDAENDLIVNSFDPVLLQAMKEDPPPDARCRDKFLVQTVAISGDSDPLEISAIVRHAVNLPISLLTGSQWQNIEKVSKSSIQERKIRVVFLPAVGSSSTPSHQNYHGQHLGDEAPPAYGSPAASFGSPGPSAVTPVNRSASDNKGRASPMDVDSTVSNPQSSATAATSKVANTAPTSGEDLRTQLADAKSEISRLNQQSQEQGLRQRKADAINQDSRERITTGTTGMGIQQQPADGVPVQIVAALCLLSFLLAYFFF